MPVSRRLVAQHAEDSQVLRTDNRRKFIVNDIADWQFLFGPGSELSSSTQILKIAAEFDTQDFESIRLAAYLFNPVTGAVDNAATCTFKIYLVTTPNWTETLLTTVTGVQLGNTYFFSDLNVSALVPAELDGDSTLMVEATVTRLSETFRDRAYFNHLGVYDSIVRLRNDVDFLNITKLDE